jgi:phosphopentomutase
MQSINRENEECCKELGNKKTQVSCVGRINEIHNKMQGKVERKEKTSFHSTLSCILV